MINCDFQNNSPLVLVVDDERALRLLLHRAMEKEGYRVTEACNGQHCLDICQEHLPDLILLDAMMPGLDGFSCCTQMQTLLGDNCPPILMITALDDQQSVNRALEAGATDYITKPIDWSVLGQRVNRLLTSRWAVGELQQKIQRECMLTVQVEAANRKLQSLSSMDSLTKITNRYYFNEYLERQWSRLQKYQLSLSLILINVSFNKAENEHQVRDEYLRQIADTISSCKLRGADLVARFGDAQFAMILPNTQAEAALQMADAIVSAVKAIDIGDRHSKIDEFVSFSLGITSVIPSSEFSVNQLISTTEKALSQGKLAASDRKTEGDCLVPLPLELSQGVGFIRWGHSYVYLFASSI
ncbi:diguanylate cyclase [Scytonema hofmannii FACHB-248]|uniref:Diguanylate cyclase n=1 Tax=Scytonema hofmannii FACHB-248 TaxID=1842502 RepID=A0ABR8GLR8_9CYAN|nr:MULTISPECIES: diguanylate cyclase [Nostocales]MBD2604346.1 diguanylate cyclase [Scytonema hofmannii FACHB-248]